jgi:probable HAF family extracellular repeat protein
MNYLNSINRTFKRFNGLRILMLSSFILFLTTGFSLANTANYEYTIINIGSIAHVGNTYAQAINDNGQIAGTSGSDDTPYHAFLYSDGTMVDIGTLGGSYSYASGINNHGHVVGRAQDAYYTTRAFLYRDGAMVDLGTLGGPYSQANAINDSGDIVGFSYTQTYSTHAFIYSNDSMQDLGTFGGLNSKAYDINNAGQVVGYAETTSREWRAFLYADGSMIDLNELIPSNSGWELTSANRINDAGQIVGQGWYYGEPKLFLYESGTVYPLEGRFIEGINLSGEMVGNAWPVGEDLHATIYNDRQINRLSNLIPQELGWRMYAATDINSSGQIIGYGFDLSSGNYGISSFLLTPNRME